MWCTQELDNIETASVADGTDRQLDVEDGSTAPLEMGGAVAAAVQLPVPETIAGAGHTSLGMAHALAVSAVYRGPTSSLSHNLDEGL